jgi:hypothetical protein
MTLKNSFYLLSTIGCLALFSEKSHGMEDALNSHRVQTFSILKSQGVQAGHDELERQAKIAPSMKNYLAYLIQEKDSKWIRGQLKCSSETEANQLVQTLKTKITTGPMVVKPQESTSGQKLPFQSLERHYWK